MVPKAILFDLDDTIISFDGVSDETLEYVCNQFIKENHTAFDADTLIETYKKIRTWYWGDPERDRIGRLDLHNTRRELFREALKNLNYNDKEKAYAMADLYNSYQDKLIRLLPNAVETLETLKMSGIRLGLITNGAAALQRAKIERFDLERHFEICLVEGEVGFGKPDLRVYEKALSLLKLNASDVWMVGDNLSWDVEAPKTLGIYSIWVNYTGEEFPNNTKCIPDKIIKSIAEIPLFIS